MATIINTPAASESSGNGMGFFLGIIALILFVTFLLFYGLPMWQRTMNRSTPQIQVPDKVDVNINTPIQ